MLYQQYSQAAEEYLAQHAAAMAATPVRGGAGGVAAAAVDMEQTPSPVKPSRVRVKRRNPFGEACPLQLKTFVQPTEPDEQIAARTRMLLHRGAARQGRAMAKAVKPGRPGVMGPAFAGTCRGTCGQCFVCLGQGPLGPPCDFCEREACEACSRECAICQEIFCSFCSVVNFDERWDRVFCMACNEEESKKGRSPPSAAASSMSSMAPPLSDGTARMRQRSVLDRSRPAPPLNFDDVAEPMEL
eukprot:m.494793 g.494793  ORF g.494793 m.494793 type:complete len:243 (-) comp41802_c0_seq1:192-920(-)